MTYTFADGGDGALKIYQDGVEVASIDGDEVSIFKNTTQGYVELSDSEHIFFGININEVSGATTLQDIVDAIESALPNDSNTGGTPGATTFSELTDAYDLSTAPNGTIPMRDATGNLIPVYFYDTDPITVVAATTAALSGTWTYDNGTAGVGATLTRTTNGVFQNVDGVAPVLNQRYLIKNWTGANRLRNGVYQLSTVGTVGTASVLTRTTDADASNELNGQVVIPSGGSVNGKRVFSQTTPNPTVGTSNIIYSAATSGGGNIRSDGSVDFTATETWDDSLGSTVAVSPSNIVLNTPGDATTVTVSPVSVVAFDGTNTTTVQAGAVITDNGAGGTSTLATASLFITDGSAAVTVAPTSLQGGGALDVTSGGNMGITSGRKIDITAGSGFNISILLSGGGKFNIGAAIFGALPVYANIAAATTAGLVSGDWFATTTTGVIVQIP